MGDGKNLYKNISDEGTILQHIHRAFQVGHCTPILAIAKTRRDWFHTEYLLSPGKDIWLKKKISQDIREG